MLNTLRTHSIRSTGLKVALSALLLGGTGVATAANVTVYLCAKAGKTSPTSTTLPASLPVWAYTTVPTAPTTGLQPEPCAATAPPTAPGGPVIDVNVGDAVTVNLSNALTEKTGLFFQGQAMVPDTTGAAALSAGTYKSYTFIANSPGTYLYQAALLPNAEHQVALGLYGALVVKPVAAAPKTDTVTVTSGSAIIPFASIQATDVGSSVSGAGIQPGSVITGVTADSFTMNVPATVSGTSVPVTISQVTAYGDPAIPGTAAYKTAYNEQAVLVLSEIDPALNNSADPLIATQANFDLRHFAPKYFLINGKTYPDTDAITSAAGHKLLLRYVNAGSKHHSMGALGLRQNFIAKDGSVLPTAAASVAAETLATGQTGDALITVPLTAAGTFAVYDASLALHNSNAQGFGGMLTFVNAGAAAAPKGPTTSAVAFNPKSTGGTPVTLTASFNSAASTVTTAEYFIDIKGADGTGTTITGGTFNTANVNTTSTISAASLASGNHTFFVHGQDATNAWGAYSFAVLNVDKVGPTTSGLSLTPNPSSGSVNVTLSATANDTATGGSNVVAAEYFRGTTPPSTTRGTKITPNVLAPVASLNATITCTVAAPCAAGNVNVRSQDELGNWGPFATIALTRNVAAPSTSPVTIARTPNNGALPLSATQAVVRATATITAASGSTVAGAEAFIDSAVVNGSGFPLVPGDGAWNGAVETGYADIPLSTINSLAAGNHTIRVHGKNDSGAWGPANSGILLIDKTAPTISSATLSPSTAKFGTASVTLNVTASDNASGVAGGQYWIDGSATPPASPTAFNGASATISTAALTGGTHTVYVRVQDGATNFSTVSSAPLTVIQAVNDTRSFNANSSATQTSDASGNNGVLSNDLPAGTAGRTAKLVSAPVRTGGTGTGTIAVSCPNSLGTAAIPAVGGNTVCTNGAYRVTLTAPASANTNALRQAAKRGTYQFTYQEILNGVTSDNATVTITVN